MRQKRLQTLLLCLGIVLVLGVTAYAAGTAGTPEDPLISKSYLDAVVQPQLEQALEEQLSAALAQAQTTENGRFTVLTLADGQVLTGSAGTELMLRRGAAKAVSAGEAAAVADTTSAAELLPGAELAANHLCVITEDGGGLSAVGEHTVVLVSGSYVLR